MSLLAVGALTFVGSLLVVFAAGIYRRLTETVIILRAVRNALESAEERAHTERLLTSSLYGGPDA